MSRGRLRAAVSFGAWLEAPGWSWDETWLDRSIRECSAVPSPLRGGVGGGGQHAQVLRDAPTPALARKRGREFTFNATSNSTGHHPRLGAPGQHHRISA